LKQRIQAVVNSRIYRPIHNKLWPNTLADLSYEEPLPPGPLGCPWKGFNAKQSDPSFGQGVLFYRLFEKLQRPRIYKFFSQSKGIAIVSGYANSKAVLTQEFDTVVSQVVPFTSKLVGESSLRCCQNGKEHATLRKLVGMAVQPTSVSKLIPALQATAESLFSDTFQFDKDDKVQMENVCLSFTLSVACRHIIGLDESALPPSEAEEFQEQVKTWIGGLYAAADDTRWKQARVYLVDKIQSKLQSLEANGPDESTVSGMLFAKDPDDPDQRRLTCEEIIENTLLLIFAGSETSAGTLTNCLLLLGLHSSAWDQVVQEQRSLMERFETETLDRTVLDASQYLDGVVRESLRIKPIVTGSMRGTKSTIIVDGYQIPAGWAVTYDRYNTHMMDPIARDGESGGSHMDVMEGFKPTRWMNPETRPRQEFIPFGAGPRYCLGVDLALVEMKTFLAVLARQIPQFDLVYPRANADSSEIAWREKGIIPVPEKGVIIRPRQEP
jgi:cytochrome P450